jgi:uncharacterized protein YlzI (FlbEa/FlbD family)
MEFIKVFDQAGRAVYVNVDHIVKVAKEGDFTRIDLDAGVGPEKCLLVKDTPEEIMELINVGRP